MGARSRFVEVADARLYVEEDGEGTAVVFLHPGLWDCRTWDEQFALFADRYRVLRYDARGYGRSSRLEPGVAYSHVRDLVAVLDDAGIERAAFIGCSMGGGIEIDFALEHPSRVAALVVIAPGLDGFEGTEEEEASWEAWDQERQAPIDALIEAGELEQAQDMRLRTMWAVLGDRRRGWSADPRDRVRQPARAHDGRERRGGPRPAGGREARGHRGADARPAGRTRPAVAPAHLLGARRRHPERSTRADPGHRPHGEHAPARRVQPRRARVPFRGPLIGRSYFLCASSFSRWASAMILSARCDGTSS